MGFWTFYLIAVVLPLCCFFGAYWLAVVRPVQRAAEATGRSRRSANTALIHLGPLALVLARHWRRTTR